MSHNRKMTPDEAETVREFALLYLVGREEPDFRRI